MYKTLSSVCLKDVSAFKEKCYSYCSLSYTSVRRLKSLDCWQLFRQNIGSYLKASFASTFSLLDFLKFIFL